MGFRFDLFLLSVAILLAPSLSDLVMSKVDRRVRNPIITVVLVDNLDHFESGVFAAVPSDLLRFIALE